MPCQSKNHTPLGLIPTDLDASDTSQETVVHAFMIPSILARSLSLGWFSQSAIGVKLVGSTLQPQPIAHPLSMLSANQLAPMSNPTHKTRDITNNDLSSFSDELKSAEPISRSTHVKAPPVQQSSVQKAKSKDLKPAQDPERTAAFSEVGYSKQKTLAPSPNLQIPTTKRVQCTAEHCHKDLPMVPAGQCLAGECTTDPLVLPQGKPFVLVDVTYCLLVMGILAKAIGTSVHQSGEGACHVYDLPEFCRPMNLTLLNPESGTFSPFPFNNQNAEHLTHGTQDCCQFPGAVYGTIQHQAYGYRTGAISLIFPSYLDEFSCYSDEFSLFNYSISGQDKGHP
ncbi:hypothetical protein CROQUDRAFT_131759 [Cronartium quercuum f. sp. fusiforme G11]|uniref:Uncharacterized protein n=1 Tax=Cronartium quercuum f. sp. fusiforme G11 TaxID=708437 RepID=A0A9P6NR24_9BASI|nr:hypothetical protein CROQUDRAFT_131759 [Cronartium quercuum f. sp. fusiforme G11]